jgi:hypothetical protein
MLVYGQGRRYGDNQTPLFRNNSSILHDETIRNATLKTPISMHESRSAENAQQPRRKRFVTTS